MGCGSSAPAEDVQEGEGEAALRLELELELEAGKRAQAQAEAARSSEREREREKEEEVKEAEERAAEEEAARVKAEEQEKEEKEEKEECARKEREEEEAAAAAMQEQEEQQEQEQAVEGVAVTVMAEAEQDCVVDMVAGLLAALKEETESKVRRMDVQECLLELCSGVEECIIQEEEEEVLQLAEGARVAAAAEQARIEAESVKVGWLSKQGHIVKNWKRRWFVLDKGVLRYYVKPLDKAPFGQGLKGEMILENYVVLSKGGRSFELQTYEDQTGVDHDRKKPGLIRRLSMGRSNSVAKIKCESTLIVADNDADADQWISLLSVHIGHYFKTDYEKSDAVQKVFMQGFLEIKGLIWNQRWFSLRLNKLEYFSDEAMTESKGFLTIIPKEMEVVPREYVKRHKFKVSNGKHSLELAAESSEVMCQWAAMLTRVGQREIADEFNMKYIEFATSFIPNSYHNDTSEQDVSTVASAMVFDCHDSLLPPVEPGAAFSESKVLETALSNEGEILNQSEEAITFDMTDPATILSQKDDTLRDIQYEVTSIFAQANIGKPHDEKRLQELISQILSNPLYKAIDDIERVQYRDEVEAYTSECLATQRSFVPPHIFQSSLESLVDNDSFRKVLATRFISRKATWLVRVSKEDFSRMHYQELTGRFNPMTQGLDIIELGAIYSILPENFTNDAAGHKSFWKRSFEEYFKEMYANLQNNSLEVYQRRNGAYKSQAPKYSTDASVHSFKVKIVKKRGSQNSLSMADKRAALERASSKPLLPSKPFL